MGFCPSVQMWEVKCNIGLSLLWYQNILYTSIRSYNEFVRSGALLIKKITVGIFFFIFHINLIKSISSVEGPLCLKSSYTPPNERIPNDWIWLRSSGTSLGLIEPLILWWKSSNRTITFSKLSPFSYVWNFDKFLV